MRYLTGVANDRIAAVAADEPALGLMLQPRSALHWRTHQFHGGFAYDNGAFGAFLKGQEFDPQPWRRGLAKLPGRALFVVVPDVVGDHDATRAAWDTYAPEVIAAGQPPAFVLQNGCASFDQVPADAEAVFIGGDDAYKLSAEAAAICWEARRRGMWVHMGRVNSGRRMTRALAMGCDSADGTFLRFGPPQVMLDRLQTWLHAGRTDGAQLDVLDHVAGGAA